MSEKDRRHWDARYTELGMAPIGHAIPPPVFAPFEDLFPTKGLALELACGRGRCALWLASRGMEVYGVDASSVAIDLARELVSAVGSPTGAVSTSSISTVGCPNARRSTCSCVTSSGTLA